ncbi:pyruvate dehydrogenase (acetyl-transferring) E1 component subunit alpha [Mycoplasmopsis felifaucium]|uniref:pyruvate dehydrogenase (acetyl-transferring) E1 component subunit alpha n=1 Tax=Mycoplasmopsis felifaucium TaxID=35768 RepID=UPI00056680D6|nr:pyruvate dehydrogenase (acetyl-transferring) E1 component subunit alpha [Mycoplasmopsis felifaucium]
MKYKYVNVDKIMDNPDEIIRFLDIDGKLIDTKNKSSLTNEELLDAYKWMVLSRQQDTYMLQLQRQGRMLTFPPNIGEEALQIATGMAMQKKDWFLPAFRSNALMLRLGVPMLNLISYWNGQEWGNHIPADLNVLPANIVIGTQISQCAGVAYAQKELKTGAVAVCFIGNGGTTEGEFSEGVNMATVQGWPAVFCINNNQWAISTPNSAETVSKTLAAKAHAFGCAGIRVDGNDLLASYEAINEAISYARNESKPVIVEFVTWRQGPHTTSDNPKLYRTTEEEKEAEKWEPMHRIENYLKSKKIIDDAQIKTIWEDALKQVKVTYEESLKNINSKLEDIFDYTYEKLDDDLLEQRAEAIAYWNKIKGGK